MRFKRILFAVVMPIGALLVLAASAMADNSVDALVTAESPPTPFPQNKQNEPAVMVDPINPSFAAGGANEEVAAGTPGTKPAPGTDCPATFGNTDIYGGLYTP